MAASVEYRREEMSSGETKEEEKGDDLSLFVDFSGDNMNPDLLQKSNQTQVTFDFESDNQLKPETVPIIHGQDSGSDNLLNTLNNITDYEWLLSPPRHPVHSVGVEEQTTLTDHIPVSNGQSTSPESKLENTPADGTSTTNVSLKLPASSSNGVKSSTIRRPSPSRKAPSTGSRSATPTTRTKPSRSSTPTPRATVTAATKPVARSTTPTPRPPVLAPASKPTSRSSTPSQRPSTLPVASKSTSSSRSSTPVQRPSVTASAKSASTSRSSTPVQRPSITASARSASRSSTPVQRPSITASAKSESRSSTPVQRPSITASAKSASRSSTPVQRSSITASAKSASRSSTPTPRPSNPAGGVKSGITRGRGRSNEDDDVNPVLMGTKMVERVVNMRKLAPPREDHISDQNNASGKMSMSQDNSGFGRSLSKKSFDMALRHLDIRRSMPGNMRATITKVPASSVYSVRPDSTKTRTTSASDPPFATSSSASSDHQSPGGGGGFPRCKP